jgi:hypothetical protein
VHGTGESRAGASAQQQEIPAPGLTHFMSSAVTDFFTPSAQRRVGLGQEADHAAL